MLSLLSVRGRERVTLKLEPDDSSMLRLLDSQEFPRAVLALAPAPLGPMLVLRSGDDRNASAMLGVGGLGTSGLYPLNR